MNKEEAIKMLKAKLECMTRDVSGRDSDCIDRRCDECSLNYEQGNMGEQKEWLKMAIEALKAQPSEDCISRKAAIDGLASIAKVKAKSDSQKSLMGRVMFFTEHLPSVAPQPKAEGARGGIPLQQSVPKMPQPKEHTEERTEMHEYDLEQIIKTTIKEYLDKEYDDVTELLLALNKDLCERIRKEK